jgi:signal transduction histidine kinase
MDKILDDLTRIDHQGHTVLVVDDNSANLTMITDYLKDCGFKTLTAISGERALQKVAHVHPDLILLDVIMPGIDGFETCRRLKVHAETKDIPVIFMTALTSTEDKVRGFGVGAVDYVTKPFRQEEILARVTTHLHIRDLTQSLQKTNKELVQTLDELKATQKQLIETEKMAALGGLVSGIAHTINTPVGIGVTAASALELETRTLFEVYENGEMTRSALQTYLEKAMQSSRLILDNLLRAADLIRSFKQVAIDQTGLEARVFPVRNYIENTLLSLKSKVEQAQLSLVVNGDDTITIHSHPGAFAQVITNLVMNSVNHAYREKESGTLCFDLTRKQDRLIIEYADDGCGIPTANLKKIFDPFFTTARNRGGVGLGMYIVYNLVTQKLKGTIHCESQVGSGTKFILNLPFEGV